MANSSSSSFRKNRYTFTIFLSLCLFLVSIFLFSKRALEPTLSLYRDVFSQSTTNSVSSHLQFSRSDPVSDPPKQNSLTHQPNSPISRTDTLDSSTSEQSINGDHTEAPPQNVETLGKISNFSVFELPIPAPLSENDRLDSSTGDQSFNGEPSVDDKENPVPDLGEKGDGGAVELPISVGSMNKCDLHSGMWVKDAEYPIYKPGSCPYVDEAYDCQNNGRGDSEYMKWRWKPEGCDLPRFNATDFLVRIRGKRLMLVGDSMNRNQFESILCLLRGGLPDKSRMYEIHGHKITKGRGYYVFTFVDYNCTVEFVRSHFLVKEGTRINGQGNSNPTLSIDQIDKTANRWKRADILVFNTGHWWTHGKTARGKNYYKEGDYVYPKFDAVEAYRRALRTWANWIDKNVNPKKQLVFYRGYSSAHFRGGDWDSGGTCNGETEPILTGAFLDSYPLKMKIVEEVILEMQVSVILLNVTRLTNFRKDGHPSIYGKNVTAGQKVSTRKQDCSHWCLPGVPDAWNELIYATLVFQQTRSSSHT